MVKGSNFQVLKLQNYTGLSWQELFIPFVILKLKLLQSQAIEIKIQTAANGDAKRNAFNNLCHWIECPSEFLGGHQKLFLSPEFP